MLSSEINEIMKTDSTFLGCYPKDRLPQIESITFPKKLILNTGRASSAGEHWVALILTRKICFYFDSFGLEIIDRNILEYLQTHYRKYTFNNICIQDPHSSKCGEFCIGFLKLVSNRNDFKKYICMFDFENLKNNDKNVSKIVKTL